MFVKYRTWRKHPQQSTLIPAPSPMINLITQTSFPITSQSIHAFTSHTFNRLVVDALCPPAHLKINIFPSEEIHCLARFSGLCILITHIVRLCIRQMSIPSPWSNNTRCFLIERTRYLLQRLWTNSQISPWNVKIFPIPAAQVNNYSTESSFSNRFSDFSNSPFKISPSLSTNPSTTP